MDSQYTYFDRDLSWLSFNRRLLDEASDDSLPIYERIKFLAIHSSNLDEFFRVRVAALRSIVRIDKKKINKRLMHDPKEALGEILAEVNRQQERFGKIKREEIIPQLKHFGIHLYRGEELLDVHKAFCRDYFRSKVLSYLQPELLLPEATIFLENRQLYFAVELSSATDLECYALLNIPSNFLPRFIELPQVNGIHFYIALDDIIRENIDFIFPTFKVRNCYSIKLNRDADLLIEDEYSGNLVKKIRKQIDKRNLGVPSRFLYDSSMPGRILALLSKLCELEKDDLVAGGRYHNMHDLFDLPNPKAPDLQYNGLPTIRVPELEDEHLLFDAIDKRDHLLHFPYQSYDYVLRFFNEAAMDHRVKEIKVTFYRIAPRSFISNALISAAKNGKKVTVFVEIKARFDELNNLKWAEKMQQAGVKIIYSMPGLKVHAKVALVIREVDGVSTTYCYLGTGNFNETTASVYADQALMTSDKTLGEELNNLFLYLAGKLEQPHFNELLVSQFNILDAFITKIDREIAHAQAGKKAYMIIKINNLQDIEMIDKLYEASNAGVKIDMIVRSICCLVPTVAGQSENITVHRIVDSYLEHSRAFYFYNDGNAELYQGSSDWMHRNLKNRIEVVFPIKDDALKPDVMKMLELQLNDDTKGVMINEKLENQPLGTDSGVRSQRDFYDYLRR